MSVRRPNARSKGRPTSRALISNQLRSILDNGEHTLFAVARDSGVTLSCLSRFVAGTRDLRLDSLDRLADVLGLKLVETGRIKVKASASPRPGSARRSVRSETPAPLQVDPVESSRTGADSHAQDE